MQLKKIITTTLFVIFTVCIIAWTIIDEPVEKPKKEKNIVIKEKEDKKEEKTNQITIDIKGAIANPGVYQLTTKNNVNDQTTPNMIQRICGIFERNPLISKEI